MTLFGMTLFGYTPFLGKPARLPVQRREPQQAQQGPPAKWIDHQSSHLVLDFSGNIECFDPFDHSRSVSSKTRSTGGMIWESIAMGILLMILCNDSVETFRECDSRIPQTALPLSQALNKWAGGSIPLQNIEVTAVCFWPWKRHWLVASCITASLPYLTFFDHILPYLTTVSWCEEVAVSVRFHQTGRPGSSWTLMSWMLWILWKSQMKLREILRWSFWAQQAPGHPPVLARLECCSRRGSEP